MAHDRRFRFGIQLTGPTDGLDWAGTARKVEDLGYSTLMLPDHFEGQLGPVPALAAAATATSTLRLATLVHGNDYRHPVMLAKEAATIDVVSDGRLEFGIGAGWMRTDYEKSGMTYDPPGTRIDRLIESVTVIKGLFGDGEVDFEGDHYTIRGLDGLPKPVQRPHPPFLIGGGGPRMLGVAAQEGDIVGLTANLRAGEVGPDAAADATGARFDQKSARVKEVAGDRYADLEINVLVMALMLTDDRQGSLEGLAAMFGIDPAEAADVPLALVGTVEEIIETLQERRERWDISYVTVQQPALDDFAPVVAALAGT